MDAQATPNATDSDAAAMDQQVVVGMVPLANACVLLCTHSARYALQIQSSHLMPARSGAPSAAHVNPFAWTLLPEPGPATLFGSIFGKFTSAGPTSVLAVALADNARHALVLTSRSLELWGPAHGGGPHAALELKRQSVKSIEHVVLGDSKDQYAITHIASSTVPLTNSDASPESHAQAHPIVVAVRAHGRSGAVQLRTVHDPWSRDAAVSNARPVEAGAASTLDPIRNVHFVALAQCKVVVQSASGIEVVTDAGAKAYLWNAGKRWFVASAPLVLGNQQQNDQQVPSIVLLELSRGMYEFRAAGFDRPATASSSALLTPASAASAGVAAGARDLFTPQRTVSPTALAPPTPLPPRTPRAQLALESIAHMSDAAKHLFDRANNLFRAHAGMQVPRDEELEHVARAFVHMGMQQPEAAEEYSDRLMHLADLVTTVVARGQADQESNGGLETRIGEQPRARVWHAAVALAIVGAQASDQVERTGGTQSARYYVQVTKDDRDDAQGKFVSKAAARYWAAMQATDGARAVSKSHVLDPFVAVLRGAMADAALALADMLAVEAEVEAIVGIAVDVAEWLIRQGDKGTAGSEHVKDALTLAEATLAAAHVLTLAHAGLASDVSTHAWRDAVRTLAQVNPLQAYALAQMHDSHVELRAQILAAGHLPNADEAMDTELHADQEFANALFKTLLAAAEDTEPAGEVSARWSVAVDKAVKFPDRFEVFLDGGRLGRVQVPSLVLAHYFVAVGNYAEAMPHWSNVMRTTPVEATAVQAVSALYFYQWVLRDQPSVRRVVDMAVVDHYQALLECQRDLATTIAAAAGLCVAPGSYGHHADMPAALVDVDVPEYVQLTVKRGGRLPLPWLIDAATPAVLVRLAHVLAKAPEAVVGPTVRHLLWTKVYHRALYLIATVPMGEDMGVFCDCEQGRQEWLRYMMPHRLAPRAWAGATDAMRALTLDQVRTVDAEVGGLHWGMIAVADVDAKVGGYAQRMWEKAKDGRVVEVKHAIATLDAVFRKDEDQAQDVDMDDEEQTQDGDNRDESMMVETERRFDEQEQQQQQLADEDAMEL
ncbi:hypothetical protein BCR44DRAFT_1053082 [Catenaria anguillulae PL171]|uniref:Uncharacterized protein n=1 Tax=Catenaria anguillulae PL171 TaxID=765915 RepID=A0A1Y2HVG2_9FUNG|nr:hypothetical protein BCR44DRAFT_1053082 [Catenaria anguillulae PL171]